MIQHARFALPPLLLMGLLGACGGSGSGGGSGAVEIAGTVRSPDGQSIGFVAESSSGSGTREPRHAGRGGRLALEIDGLLPVPDGTPVELLRVAADGAPLESLASTTTVGGAYAFDLDGLGLPLANDLWVAAGSGATTLRAPAVREQLDVDPLSEALIGLVLAHGTLDGFTLDELADLLAGLELVARVEDLAAVPDLAATIALCAQAGLDDGGWSAFLVAASQAGTTDVGPGDVGDYFPSSIGDVWGVAGTSVVSGEAPVDYTAASRVVDALPDGTLTLEQSDSRDPDAVVETFLRETTRALVFLGNDDESDPLNSLEPFELARFPLQPGKSWEQFDERGLSLGIDLDGDLLPEVVDLESERMLLGFEQVDTPAGTFDDCAHLSTDRVIVLRFTSGPLVRATVTEHDWYAPGLGEVQSTTNQVLSGASVQLEEDVEEQLTAFLVGGAGHGILPPRTLATELAPASSDQEEPGRPGVGADGTGYVVVTCRAGAGNARLVALLVGANGLVKEEVVLRDLGVDCGFASPAVVFDGANYLVAFHDEGEVLGLRLTPDGDVLDAQPFPISEGGVSNFSPAAAFDGTNTLVVWRKFDDATSGDVFGALVTPDGDSLGEFAIHVADADQSQPTVTFGGGNHLVAWSDGAGGTPQVRGVRVGPAGDVLDDPEIDIAGGVLAESSVRVASDGTRYLAVWSGQALGGARHLRAARVELDGSVTDPLPATISDANVQSTAPDVVFDGTNYLIAWQLESSGSPEGLRAARFTSAGVLLDGPSNSGGLEIAAPSGSALPVRPALARGTASSFLAWILNRQTGGETKDARGTLVFPF